MHRLDTTPFTVSHGRNPRGRGSWAFSTDPEPDVLDPLQVMWSPSLTYTEAVRWARATALARSLPADATLYVLP